MKKISAALLAIVMLLTLAACGSDSGSSGGSHQINADVQETNGFYMLQHKDADLLSEPETKLDAASIYSKLTYDHKMFYGNYRILGGEAGEKSYAADMDYMEHVAFEGKKYTAIPYRIEAGPNTINHIISQIPEINPMIIYLYAEGGYMNRFFCDYSIEGNTLKLNPFKTYAYDDATKTISYELSDEILEYTFAFKGMELTLEAGGKSVTLHGNLFPSNDDPYMNVEHYLSEGSKRLDCVDYIGFRWHKQDGSRLYVDSANREESHNSTGKLTKDGLFTFTVHWEAGAKTYQYVYFYCGYDGIVLTDGNEIYYYNDTYSDRNSNRLKGNLNIEDLSKLENMTDSALEALVQKKADLFADLAAAYQNAGLDVRVDEMSGEIAMDPTVLFEIDKSVIGEEGKAFLKKFMEVYNSVVFSDKYADFVSTIMVEGHTDTSGSYEHNAKLSQERADSVKAYCLSDECGVDGTLKATLNEMLQAKGYSYDKPVYAEDGSVDMDASRRVAFRFLIKLG